MNTSPFPKADRASEDARLKFSSSSSALCTTRIPRPPPPCAALMMTGYPTPDSMKPRASSKVETGPSVPGTTGTPTFSPTKSTLY